LKFIAMVAEVGQEFGSKSYFECIKKELVTNNTIKQTKDSLFSFIFNKQN